MVGAMLGRQFWMPFGTGKIFPNQYVMLIGSPGTRKSSAVKTARKLLGTTGYQSFAAEKTTKEKFLLDLEGSDEDLFVTTHGRPGASKNSITAADVLANLDLAPSGDAHDGIPREVFIVADEFNDFAGTGNLDFLSMLGVLWDWDDEDTTYKQRFKNTKSISIFQPTVSILSGNTHAGFKLAFPEQALGQGFLSRLVLVHSEPSGKKVSFPKPPPAGVADALKERLTQIRETVRGAAVRSKEAEQALDTIYRTFKDLEDYRFKSYSSRRYTHLLKLCLLVAAMRLSTTVELKDVILANSILTYTESSMPKALGEFGRSKDSDAQHNIMTALYESHRPLGVEDLWKVVSRDLDKTSRLVELLQSLTQAGKIQLVPNKPGYFLPVQRPVVSPTASYVDLSLLKEYKAS